MIWSTYPIATTVLAGGILARLSGRPWIVDLRDSMTEENFPLDPMLRQRLRKIEATAVHRGRAVVLTSLGTRKMYAERYTDVPDDRWVQIPNGYDEHTFQAAERLPSSRRARTAAEIVLLHSGLLDPVDRNPTAFFRAVARLRHAGVAGLSNLRIVLRATGHEDTYSRTIDEMGIGDIVELAPPLPYVEALREMLDADGLLIFQAGNCNHQTPAKLYEYLRAGRPILAMTDLAGDTATVMRAAGFPGHYVALITETDEIEQRLRQFLQSIVDESAIRPTPANVGQWSRSEQSVRLARLLDQATESPPVS